MGYKDCFVDSEIIASGSVEQVFEGWHYLQFKHLHKEAIIFQTKIESQSKNVDPLLVSQLKELQKSPSLALVEEIMKLDAFKDIKQHIVSTTGIEVFKVFEGCVNNTGYCLCNKRR